LLDKVEIIVDKFNASINERYGVVLAGSAGGGIQLAAELLAKAGMLAGLHTTMKGEYPVTVGTGFSVAEVILSRKPINYTGLDKPDVIFIMTDDGLVKVKNLIEDDTMIIADDILSIAAKNVSSKSFSKKVGKRSAVLSAISYWIAQTNIIPQEAFIEAIKPHKHADLLIKAIETPL
ncbi:MAG: 2-oxoacid:acceptor oxidoreductase family protein, partial [Flavobacteriaceae bacterium]|nr:2-oxoacid:acceptor oxidoreductase family protein [Flavobacteriaceae bacterium]